MTIGQSIRALRKQRGLTQNQLGERCGLSGASIGGYEKGAVVPKRRVVEKLARALEVPADKLTGVPAPSFEAAESSGVPLYDGVLSALKELYGSVEGRVIVGENGTSKKYYVIRDIPDSFVLYEQDIAAIARSARASMTSLAARLGNGERGA